MPILQLHYARCDHFDDPRREVPCHGAFYGYEDDKPRVLLPQTIATVAEDESDLVRAAIAQGWYVDGQNGGRILCPDCRLEQGLGYVEPRTP